MINSHAVHSPSNVAEPLLLAGDAHTSPNHEGGQNFNKACIERVCRELQHPASAVNPQGRGVCLRAGAEGPVLNHGALFCAC